MAMMIRRILNFYAQCTLFFVLLLVLSNIYPFYAARPWSPIHIVPNLFTARIYVAVYVAIFFLLMLYLFVLPYSYVMNKLGTGFRLKWFWVPLGIALFQAIAALIEFLPVFFTSEESFRVAITLLPVANVLNVLTYIIHWIVIPILIPIVLVKGLIINVPIQNNPRILALTVIKLFLTTTLLRPLIDWLICLGIVFVSHCYPCIFIYLRGYHPEAFQYLTMVMQGKLKAMYMTFPTWGTLISYIAVGYINGKILHRYLQSIARYALG